jgi:hypothetical protein
LIYKFEDETAELFNVVKGIGEQEDIAAKRQKLAKGLKRK